jgi:hypothetical protein
VRGSGSVLVRLLNELVSGRSARRPVAMLVFPYHHIAEKRAYVMKWEVDVATAAE